MGWNSFGEETAAVKRDDFAPALTYESEASRVWDGLARQLAFICLSLSLSHRPKLPLRHHPQGLQQRGRGDPRVRERHHQAAVGYGFRTAPIAPSLRFRVSVE